MKIATRLKEGATPEAAEAEREGAAREAEAGAELAYVMFDGAHDARGLVPTPVTGAGFPIAPDPPSAAIPGPRALVR